MATVSLTINGRTYDVACDDGQEDHLRALGSLLEERLQGLVKNVGQVGEARLLMMTGLLLADEVKAGGSGAGAPRDEAGIGGATATDDAATAAVIEKLAEKVERIAARLEDA